MGMRGALYRVWNRIKDSIKDGQSGLFYCEVICNTLAVDSCQGQLLAALVLDLWKTAVSYLWISCFRYTGTFELDQSDEQRKSFCPSGVYPFGFHCMIYYLAYGFQS